MNKYILLALAVLTNSASAFASSVSFSNPYNYFSAGLHFGEIYPKSLKAFLGENYANSDSSALIGWDFNGSYNFEDSGTYLKSRALISAIENINVNNYFLGVGHYIDLDQRVSVFSTLGANVVTLERRHTYIENDYFTGYGPAIDLGLNWTPLNFLRFIPSYRISYLKHNIMSDYNVMADVMFFKSFSIGVGATFNTYKNSRQVNYTTSVKFSF